MNYCEKLEKNTHYYYQNKFSSDNGEEFKEIIQIRTGKKMIENNFVSSG